MSNNINIGKTAAIVVVVAALLFVAYGELSNSASGALGYQDRRYEDCSDSDSANNPAVKGTLTVMKVNFQTDIRTPEEHPDRCLGARKIQQWKCGPNNTPQELDRYCEDTCSNGVCV